MILQQEQAKNTVETNDTAKTDIAISEANDIEKQLLVENSTLQTRIEELIKEQRKLCGSLDVTLNKLHKIKIKIMRFSTYSIF